MDAWDEVYKPPVVPPPPPSDPAGQILAAIADVRGIVAGQVHSTERFWLRLEQLEKDKATRVELASLETRMREVIHDKLGRTSDEIVRIEQSTENTTDAYDSLDERMRLIEIETAKIGTIEGMMMDMAQSVSKLDQLRWQMVGGATVVGFLGMTVGLAFGVLGYHFHWPIPPIHLW